MVTITVAAKIQGVKSASCHLMQEATVVITVGILE